jgi:hypothetical protein
LEKTDTKKLIGAWGTGSAGPFFSTKELADKVCNGYDYAYWVPKTYSCFMPTNKKKVSFKQIDVKDVAIGQEIYVIGNYGKKLKATLISKGASLLLAWKNKPKNYNSWSSETMPELKINNKHKYAYYITSDTKLYKKQERENVSLGSLSSGDRFLFHNDQKKLVKGTFINANSKSSNSTLIVFKNKPKNKKVFKITSDQYTRYNIDPSFKYCLWMNQDDLVYFHSKTKTKKEMKNSELKDCKKGDIVSFSYAGRNYVNGTFYGVGSCRCCAKVWFENNDPSLYLTSATSSEKSGVPEKFKYYYIISSDMKVSVSTSSPSLEQEITNEKKQQVLLSTLNSGDEVIWTAPDGKNIKGIIHKHGSYYAICCKSNPDSSYFRTADSTDRNGYAVPNDITHIKWFGDVLVSPVKNNIDPSPNKEKEILSKKKDKRVNMKQLSSFKIGDEVTLYLDAYGNISTYKTRKSFKGILLAKPSYNNYSIGIKKAPTGISNGISRNTLYSYNFSSKKHLTKGLTQYISVSKYTKAKASPIKKAPAPIDEVKVKEEEKVVSVKSPSIPKELINIKAVLPYLFGATAMKFGAHCLESKDTIKKIAAEQHPTIEMTANA